MALPIVHISPVISAGRTRTWLAGILGQGVERRVSPHPKHRHVRCDSSGGWPSLCWKPEFRRWERVPHPRPLGLAVLEVGTEGGRRERTAHSGGQGSHLLSPNPAPPAPTASSFLRPVRFVSLLSAAGLSPPARSPMCSGQREENGGPRVLQPWVRPLRTSLSSAAQQAGGSPPLRAIRELSLVVRVHCVSPAPRSPHSVVLEVRLGFVYLQRPLQVPALFPGHSPLHAKGR